MKNYLIAFILLLSIKNWGQNLEWKPLSENLFMAVVSEKGQDILNDSDPLTLEFYQFEWNEDINYNEFQNSEIQIPITKEELSSKFQFNQDLKLYKNSEYLLRHQFVNDSISINIILDNEISDPVLQALKNELEKNFGKKNLEFTSKKLIKDPFGTLGDEVIPASFELKLKNTEENKSKVENWIKNNENKNGISEISKDSSDSVSLLLRIKT